MIVKFLVSGAVLTGLTITTTNIWFANKTDNDETVVKTAVYRGIRYGVLWPKTWYSVFQDYQQGKDWLMIFRPTK